MSTRVFEVSLISLVAHASIHIALQFYRGVVILIPGSGSVPWYEEEEQNEDDQKYDRPACVSAECSFHHDTPLFASCLTLCRGYVLRDGCYLEGQKFVYLQTNPGALFRGGH
jgi:hypothetical protein